MNVELKPEETLTSLAFNNWIRRACPGDVAIYHYGSLMNDRATQCGLDTLAYEVMTASEKGLVFLTQKLVKTDNLFLVEGETYAVYEYRATRARAFEQPVVRRTIQWTVK